MMTSTTNNKHGPSTIDSLPYPLLVDVVCRVASASLTDLLNVKLCCKAFRSASYEDCIFENVSLDKIEWTSLSGLSIEGSLFIERCENNGNPEALYRRGLKEYFTYKQEQPGLQMLKTSAEKGHVDAAYVCGIILYCAGGELGQQGLQLLSSLKSKGLMMKQCRERNTAVIRCMWINRCIAQKQDSIWHEKACQYIGGKVRNFEIGWPSEEEEDLSCDCCMCDREVHFFCKILPILENNYY